jgi:hypothetical protein
MAAPNIPVIGHCLGGQLMSKALGGKITRNPVKEIGWGGVAKTMPSPVIGWAISPGQRHRFPVAWRNLQHANWRYPAADKCLLQQSDVRAWPTPRHAMPCRNDTGMIATWCSQWADEATVADYPSVQTPEK